MSVDYLNALKEQIEKTALRYAVENRLKYGVAKVGPVTNKVLGEFKELKQRAKDVAKIVEEVVNRVNSLSDTELKNLAEALGLLEQKEVKKEERVLPPLPNVESWGVVVTRFAPNPDFPIHLGNARAAILSHEYAKMYKGKFVLRFEDTDPRIKRPLTFSYKVVEEDLAWLGIKWDEKYIQSLRIETFYEIAKKLIEMNYAYVDLCKAEVFREYRNAGKACPHRNQDPAQNMELFEKILAGEFREGEAVIRLKTDLSHPDPSVRDWVMMRIVDVERYPHPIVGDRYRLWPTYNFAAAVDDHLMGITHILRGKEHAVNTVKQLFLYKYLGWRYPEVVHFGRVGLEGLILSKSWIKTRLKEHPERFMGFDDIRFATIAALRRRGILPETIREVIISLGLSPTDARVSWANIAAINRKNADPIAKRLFVVCKPIRVIISGVELPKEVEIPYHPSKDLGKRRIVLTKPEVYVSEYDVQKLAPGSVVRLMELFNIEIKQIDRNVVTAVYHSSDLETARRFSAPIIQWVPCENSTRIELISADGMRLRRTLCIGESSVALLKKDEIIQMVRIGFGRIDEIKKNRVRIILAHE